MIYILSAAVVLSWIVIIAMSNKMMQMEEKLEASEQTHDYDIRTLGGRVSFMDKMTIENFAQQERKNKFQDNTNIAIFARLDKLQFPETQAVETKRKRKDRSRGTVAVRGFGVSVTDAKREKNTTINKKWDVEKYKDNPPVPGFILEKRAKNRARMRAYRAKKRASKTK